MAATIITGAESTGNVSSSQAVRDVASRLRYLDPEAAPFTLLLDATSSEPANNFKVEWAEKGGNFSGAGFAPKWFQSTAAYTDAITIFTVDDATVGTLVSRYAKANDLIKVVRTGEIMRVVSTTDTTLTVARAIGTVAAATINDNDDMVIIGSTWAENADVGVPSSFQEAWKYNLTQIFRTPAGASRTQMQTKNYLGDVRTRLRHEAGIEHKIGIERAFLYGERNTLPTSTAAPVRELGGYFYWATSNITDVNGTLTEPTLWAHAAQVFAHTAGGNTRTMFAGATVCSAIDLIAGARLMTVPKDETYGIAIKTLLTSHGTFNIIKHRLLETGYTGSFPSGQFSTATIGYGGFAITVNLPSLKYRPLQTTEFLPNRQGNGVDGFVDEYLTEATLEFSNPLLSGTLLDVSG